MADNAGEFLRENRPWFCRNDGNFYYRPSFTKFKIERNRLDLVEKMRICVHA